MEFLTKQRLLQQAKLKPLYSKSFSLRKLNLLKSKTSGNVLGKALSGLKFRDKEDEFKKKLERQLIREKERQIDELIFNRKNNEEFIEMKDFL